MKELIVEILKIITPISVALIVFAQGLGIVPGRVWSYFKEEPGRMLRSLIATLVLVPAAALAMILVLKPSPALAIALAILVACPPAPLMFNTAPNLGGGSAAFMASLHLTLAALAFLTVPAVLELLSIPLGFHADVNMGAMAWILARTILIPIGLGLAIRAFLPATADRIAPMLGKVGMIGLLIVVLFALVSLYPALLNTDGWSYLVIAAVSAAALAIGHLSGPKDPREKTILAVECGVRHPALALNIGAASLGRPEALPVLVPCVLTFIAVAIVYMIWRGRSR
jgi:BASS family bile acid:Na+ symporter